MTASSSAAQDFADFVTAYGRGLGRLAYLLVGDSHTADDLMADVMLAVWRQWEQVSAADHPVGYVRQMMVNQASGRHRRAAREREGLTRLRAVLPDSSSHVQDSDAVVDVRAVLQRMPPGQRACLVLRYAFDLSEREVAETLGVHVGTVKSQTSKAAAYLRRELGDSLVDARSSDTVAPTPAPEERKRLA